MSIRLGRYAVRLAMIVVGLLLCLAAMYFVHGSLEQFPTDEDHGKVRLVTAVAVAVLAVTEVGLWRILRYLEHRAIPCDRAADGLSPPAA